MVKAFYSNTATEYEGTFYGPFGVNSNGYTASMQKVDDVYLKRIEFNNGYITFETEDRKDMRVTSYANNLNRYPQKLKSFEVFNLFDESIKKVSFDYGYFNESNNTSNRENFLRLRLDRVQESFMEKTGLAYIAKPAYEFFYEATDRSEERRVGKEC